ncbi:MAG: DUF3307 domain-containing protein [Pseudomonadota bacterium]
MLFNDLFWLVTLHFIVDFQLQSDFIAANKVPGSYSGWPWVLTAHAAAHGAAVALIINPIFGLAEFAFHWALDYTKAKGGLGQGAIGIMVDQILHISLKFVWLGLSLAI